MKKLIFIIAIGFISFIARSLVVVTNRDKLQELYSAFLAESILKLNNGQDVIRNLLLDSPKDKYLLISLIYQYDIDNDTIKFISSNENLTNFISESELDTMISVVDSLIKVSIKNNGLLIPYFIHPEAYVIRHFSMDSKPYTSIVFPFVSSFFQRQWIKEKELNKDSDPIDFIHRWITKVKNTSLTIYRIEDLPTMNNLPEWEDSVRKLPRETIRLSF